MKELAASLQITDGNNWKKFAQQIGFTKSEIKNKLQVCSLTSNLMCACRTNISSHV